MIDKILNTTPIKLRAELRFLYRKRRSIDKRIEEVKAELRKLER